MTPKKKKKNEGEERILPDSFCKTNVTLNKNKASEDTRKTKLQTTVPNKQGEKLLHKMLASASQMINSHPEQERSLQAMQSKEMQTDILSPVFSCGNLSADSV